MDRGKSGTQIVLVAAAGDLPVGACLCGANRQDATFAGEALASVVLPSPAAPGGPDARAMPYVRADGNFANKRPASRAAQDQGYRLWAPDVRNGQSRRGLGRVRSCVERAHALLNQFGRVARRWDRKGSRYLGWVQLAACLIFMRQGFFP